MKLFRKASDVDMTQGPIGKHILLFSLPMIIGNIFQMLYSTVDALVVGNYVGKEALAAVGSMGPATTVLVNLFSGFSLGAGVVLSRHYGSKDDGMVKKTASTIYLLTVILSLFFPIAGLFLIDPLLWVMKMPSDVYGMAKEYLTIYFLGLVWSLIYNMGSAVLRAIGDSARPLYFLIVSSVVHILLDWVFVAKMGLGVAGAGYSTLLSQLVSAILVIVALLRAKSSYRLDVRALSLSLPLVKQIVKIGLPSAVQSTAATLSNLLIQSYINAFGSACMASWSVFQQVDAYATMPIWGASAGLSTFAGQNLGANQPERVRKATRFSLTVAMSVAVSVQILIMIFAPHLVRLFNSDPTVISFGTLFLRFIGPVQVLASPATLWFGMLRGAGLTMGPSIISLTSNIVVKLVYFAVATALGASFPVLIAGFPVCWVVCLVWGYLYYRFSHWEEKSKKIFAQKQ